MKSISLEQVLLLYNKMINITGGENGIGNLNLLESALKNAFITFDGIELYRTIEEKCANICYCIIKNHPFIDGNKRMGLYVMLILLEYNGVNLKYDQVELIDLGLGIANSKYDQQYICNWILGHKE